METAPPHTSRSNGHALKWLAALSVGVPIVIMATGALYSLSGIHGGHYGAAAVLALAHGGLLWLVYRLGGGRRVNRAAIWLLLAATSFGPLAVGHAIGYGDLRSLAYRMVQDDGAGRYPAGWKAMSREALFPHWVGQVTGTQGDGFSGYLRAQAAVGWQGRERINKAQTLIERTGLWVWLAWSWHLVFFFLAGAVAYFAAAGPPGKERGGNPAARPAPPTPTPGFDEWGRGPADPKVAGTWSGCNEQQRTQVFFHYAPGSQFASLEGFYTDRVTRHLAPATGTPLDADVRNYRERVCTMRPITRLELMRLIDRHAGCVPRGEVPRIPEDLKSACICRDEPAVVEVIWDTGRGYWAMNWSRDDFAPSPA